MVLGVKSSYRSRCSNWLCSAIRVTAANIADIAMAKDLIRPDDEVVFGDAGFIGLWKRPEILADEHLASIDYRICARPSSLKITKNYEGINWDKLIESRKASMRCKVEHPFQIVKRFFGYNKTVYRGLKKNLNRLYFLFASANLVMCMRAGRTNDFCVA